MFALALVNVDADPPGSRRRHHHPGGPHPDQPRRPTPCTRRGPDRIDVDQYTHKTATRQRWHWSTSIRSPPRTRSPRNRESPVSDDNVGSGQRRCRGSPRGTQRPQWPTRHGIVKNRESPARRFVPVSVNVDVDRPAATTPAVRIPTSPDG